MKPKAFKLRTTPPTDAEVAACWAGVEGIGPQDDVWPHPTPAADVTLVDMADPNTEVEFTPEALSALDHLAIGEAEKHPWSLGCRTCQHDAEQRVEELEAAMNRYDERRERGEGADSAACKFVIECRAALGGRP